MEKLQETDESAVRTQDLDKLCQILDTLIVASEKHNINAKEGTLDRWRNDILDLKPKVNKPPKTKIAVYGNTGEGKSSLLNALFKQPDLLPTSGMGDACTSVIIKTETVKDDSVNNGKEGFQADIIFLSKEEWQKEVDLIKKDICGDGTASEDKEQESADDDRAKELAKDKLRALYGEFDPKSLDTTIESRTDVLEKIGTTLQTGVFSKASELSAKIEDYIIAKEDGKQYWPVVKCAVIRLFNSLVWRHEVEFVDLPGIADSNPNRVEMAEKERQSARLLLVVTRIARCKASPTVESIIGEAMLREVTMDQQEVIVVCTHTDNVDTKEALKLMDSAEKEEAKGRQNKIAEYQRILKRRPGSTQSETNPSEEATQLQMFREKHRLCQQHLSVCAFVRARAIKENFRKTTGTAVFCVSSTDYFKHTTEGSMDQPVFSDENDTEIPLLRQHLEKLALEGNRRNLLSIKRQYHSVLADTHSYLNNFTMTGKGVI